MRRTPPGFYARQEGRLSRWRRGLLHRPWSGCGLLWSRWEVWQFEAIGGCPIFGRDSARPVHLYFHHRPYERPRSPDSSGAAHSISPVVTARSRIPLRHSGVQDSVGVRERSILQRSHAPERPMVKLLSVQVIHEKINYFFYVYPCLFPWLETHAEN